MKFARSLQAAEQPELHALYKQLKKSLRILDEPADARSAVEPPQPPSSSDDEELGDPPDSPSHGSGGGGGGADVAPRGLDPDQEARFVSLVEACVQELNEDFLSREEMLVIKADLVGGDAAAAGGDAAAALAAYRAAVDLHGELVLLCHWSMMAYTGIVKILKKHYKRTGQRVQSALLGNLLTQPFCSLEEVREIIRTTEHQIAELGGRLGLAPAAGPSAGAAAAAAVRDPAGQAAPVEGLLARHEAAAAGGPGPAAPQQPQDAAQPPPPGAQPHAERGQGGAQEAAEEREEAKGQLGEAAARQEVPLLATSGSGRAVLKRDRSKVYCQPNKRQELAGQEAAPQQPQSSGSSLPPSAGGDRGSVGPGHAAAAARRGSGSGGGTPLGGSPMASSPVVGSPQAPAARRPSILQRTRAALQLWKSLKFNASTPSTVLAQPQQQQQQQQQQPQQQQQMPSS